MHLHARGFECVRGSATALGTIGARAPPTVAAPRPRVHDHTTCVRFASESGLWWGMNSVRERGDTRSVCGPCAALSHAMQGECAQVSDVCGCGPVGL